MGHGAPCLRVGEGGEFRGRSGSPLVVGDNELGLGDGKDPQPQGAAPDDPVVVDVLCPHVRRGAEYLAPEAEGLGLERGDLGGPRCSVVGRGQDLTGGRIRTWHEQVGE